MPAQIRRGERTPLQPESTGIGLKMFILACQKGTKQSIFVFKVNILISVFQASMFG